MTEAAVALISQYRARGVLVDTNILLLYFVGQFDRSRISRFKRTRQFTIDDYDLLVRILSCFESILTTPNILSEVNSLSGQFGEPVRTRYFEQFARGIATLDEHYLASDSVAQSEHFSRLGLTDSGIVSLAKSRYLVLTDDFRLTGFLENAGIHVINFNHLRLTQES